MTAGEQRQAGSSHKVRRVPTELQLLIIQAKADGATGSAIARALKLGERTVRRHLADLSQHVGVTGEAALMAEAGRRGWVDSRVDPGHGDFADPDSSRS